MARRVNSVYTNYPLPEDSIALDELDKYCEEWTKTRTEATKDIMIAWAKARRGDPAALLASIGQPGLLAAMQPQAVVPASTVPSPEPAREATTTEAPAPKPTKRPRPVNGNAAAAELDI